MKNTKELSLKKKKKDNSRTTIWPSNPTSEHVPGESHNLKIYMHPSVHCSTIYSSQDMEATLMSIDIWMDTEDMVHINNHSGTK